MTVEQLAAYEPVSYTHLDVYKRQDKLEAFGDANYLKGGIVYADRITTVSHTYAEEIKTPFFGEHLDGLMRARAGRCV